MNDFARDRSTWKNRNKSGYVSLMDQRLTVLALRGDKVATKQTG
ncbi:MAG: hypothetical protein ACYTXT_13505 [Nostoc sp.]